MAAEIKGTQARQFLVESCRLFANTIQQATADLQKRALDKVDLLSKEDELAFKTIVQNADKFCHDTVTSIDDFVTAQNDHSKSSSDPQEEEVKPIIDAGVFTPYGPFHTGTAQVFDTQPEVSYNERAEGNINKIPEHDHDNDIKSQVPSETEKSNNLPENIDQVSSNGTETMYDLEASTESPSISTNGVTENEIESKSPDLSIISKIVPSIFPKKDKVVPNKLVFDDMYGCSECPMIFPTLQNLKAHTMNEHGKKLRKRKQRTIWKCETCGLIYQSRDYLRLHTKTIHGAGLEQPSTSNPQHSTFDQNEDTDEYDVDEVKQERDEWKCGLCDLVCGTKEALKDHALIHVQFDTISTSSGAMGNTEDNSKNVQSQGLEQMSVTDMLETSVTDGKSMEVRSGEKPGPPVYPSDQQSLNSVTLDGKIRKRQPRKNTIWKCKKCSVVFTYRDHLRDHMRTVHREKPYKKRQKTIINQTNVKQTRKKNPYVALGPNDNAWNCELCNVVFKSRDLLREHTKNSHGTGGLSKNSIDIDKDQPCICDHCGIVCTNYKKYKSHLTSHLKPYKCGKCEKRFAQRYMLTRHELLHTGEKPHKCDVCDMSFYRKILLKAHVTKEHSRVRFNCEHCGKNFMSNVNLRFHIMRAHTNERPHICDVCGKGFVKDLELRYHMAQHNNPRDFKCEQCNAAFCNQVSLNKHKQRIHSAEKHICHICAKEFNHHTRLTLHMRVHSTERNYKCEYCGQEFRWVGNLRKHVARHKEGPQRPGAGSGGGNKDNVTPARRQRQAPNSIATSEAQNAEATAKNVTHVENPFREFLAAASNTSSETPLPPMHEHPLHMRSNPFAYPATAADPRLMAGENPMRDYFYNPGM